MKSKITLTVFLLLWCFVSFAQQPFITTWQSVFGSASISFGTVTTGPVAYSWETLPPAAPASGSGTFEGPNVTITGLPNAERIRLTIQPQNFKRIFGIPFSYNISEINQWGTVEWISMENAFDNSGGFFSNGVQLVTATDLPNLTNVTSMKNMFKNCPLLNSPFNLNFWNISNVTDLSGMFSNCTIFNQALSLWNTSNVTDMSSMFEGAINFNQNIGNWNTSNVTNMNKMFKDAPAFNRNIGNWNTASVTNMSEMFSNNIFSGFPSAFNQNIGNWNTANVTNLSGMFRGAIVFNQNIGNWNTSNVTDMSDMFNQAFSFNQNIGNWNTSNVTNMSGMFESELVGFTAPFATTSLFNNGGSTSIQNWNTSNVTDMSRMFFRAENFNYNLGNWVLNSNVSLIEMLDRSGLDCTSYSQTLIGWNNNPNTPNNKILGATFMEYGPEAVTAINNLVFNKGWGFSGHDFISTIPSFNFPTTFCQGSTIPPLPTISVDGISGVWSPELNNTQTTTYTFIPNVGECATTAVITISITPNIVPNFAPVSSICSGQVLAPLPTSSTNGIIGSWSPALNNSQTTTYTFTPNTGQCALTTTLTITVNPTVTPIFVPVAAICFGEPLAPLPTLSTNGISGLWSPALNNSQTTTYTFTPNSGQCALTTTLTITVNPTVTPTFAPVASICSGATLAPLPTSSTNGISGSWSPALNNSQTTTYTFTPNAGQCALSTTLTITVNPSITPSFAAVPAICFGEPLAPLPTSSTNGISGSWLPALNNSQTTTYTFTPNSGQCALTTTLTITVNPTVTPTFDTIAAICSGATLAPLPTSSNNGISGSWSPALNNSQTTTYTFTPNAGQCALTTTSTITINQIATPSGDSNQTLSPNSIISDIIISPSNVIWFATLANALDNVNPLSANLVLENNTTYYAVNDDGICRSEPFPVTISISLSVLTSDNLNFVFYPNPVNSILNISASNIINKVEVYNLLGQLIKAESFSNNTIVIDMFDLPKSIYLIRVKSENALKEFKVSKQ